MGVESIGKFIDMIGQKHGKLTVIDRYYKSGIKQAYWKCLCDCGNETTVSGTCLRSERIRSCGCLQRKAASALNYKHGLSKTRMFRIWCDMRMRCDYKKSKCYARYGGRSITYCDEWKSFSVFAEWALKNGYTDNLTLDRKDNDGNYEPSNCRFITNDQQQLNRGNNHLISYKGKTLTVKEWSDITGISSTTIILRLKRGWDVATTLEKLPVDVNKTRNGVMLCR